MSAVELCEKVSWLEIRAKIALINTTPLEFGVYLPRRIRFNATSTLVIIKTKYGCFNFWRKIRTSRNCAAIAFPAKYNHVWRKLFLEKAPVKVYLPVFVVAQKLDFRGEKNES